MKTPTLLLALLIHVSAFAQQTTLQQMEQQQDAWHLQNEVARQQRDIDMLRLSQYKVKKNTSQTEQDLQVLQLLQQLGGSQASAQPTQEQKELTETVDSKKTLPEKLAVLAEYAMYHPRNLKEAEAALTFQKRVLSTDPGMTPEYRSNAIAAVTNYMNEYLKAHPNLPADGPCLPFDKVQ